jgi:hypothetical protein
MWWIPILIEKFGAKMMAKMDACLQEMMAWRKVTTACQEATKSCLQKSGVNPEKMKAGLEEMDVAVEMIGATGGRTRDRAFPAWPKGRSHK